MFKIQKSHIQALWILKVRCILQSIKLVKCLQSIIYEWLQNKVLLKTNG